jgi:hypothetical protein
LLVGESDIAAEDRVRPDAFFAPLAYAVGADLEQFGNIFNFHEPDRFVHGVTPVARIA